MTVDIDEFLSSIPEYKQGSMSSAVSEVMDNYPVNEDVVSKGAGHIMSLLLEYDKPDAAHIILRCLSSFLDRGAAITSLDSHVEIEQPPFGMLISLLLRLFTVYDRRAYISELITVIKLVIFLKEISLRDPGQPFKGDIC